MNELPTYLAELDWVLAQQLACVEGLTAGELRWRPGMAGANNVSAIVGHTVAVTRAFVLGVVAGHPLERDRPAEFETMFDSATELSAAVQNLRARLRAFDQSEVELDAAVLPSAAAWGSPVDAAMPRRQVMAEALRHSAIHLGELRFTRSLIDAERSKPS